MDKDATQIAIPVARDIVLQEIVKQVIYANVLLKQFLVQVI
jgi:hypothetical protein